MGVRSEIYEDFYAHLAGIEKAVASFKSRPVKEWDWMCWTGFYMELQKQLGEGEWGYVSNPSGGFMGFTWHWQDQDTKYLQLEEGKLCFKIWVEEKPLRADKWTEWHHTVMDAVKLGEINLKRPSRRGSGSAMTVASLDEDYRQVDDQGVLDLQRTIDVLRQAEHALDSAVKGTLVT